MGEVGEVEVGVGGGGEHKIPGLVSDASIFIWLGNFLARSFFYQILNNYVN